MEVSYALSPSGEPPPCKRALTRALEDWDIVTAETVLGGGSLGKTIERLNNIFVILRGPVSNVDRRTWLGACEPHSWLSHATLRGSWTSSDRLLPGGAS